jgi:HSP20 family protein
MAIRDLIPWKREEKTVPVRREEGHPMQTLQRDMDQLFDEFFKGLDIVPFRAFEETWDAFSPRVDVAESDEQVQVSVELPGMDEKDIDVSLSHDVLTVSGEKKEEMEDRGRNYYRIERSYGSFQRSIPLPCEVEVDKTEAVYKKGVLTITLPKTAEARCRQKISVKTG